MSWVLKQSYPESAERLYLAGLILAGAGDAPTAAHLFGVATECALKATLERGGITVDRRSGFKTHIPDLINVMLQKGSGRHMAPILKALRSLRILSNEYMIDTRYAADGCIDGQRCLSWQKEAETILVICGFFP